MDVVNVTSTTEIRIVKRYIREEFGQSVLLYIVTIGLDGSIYFKEVISRAGNDTILVKKACRNFREFEQSYGECAEFVKGYCRDKNINIPGIESKRIYLKDLDEIKPLIDDFLKKNEEIIQIFAKTGRVSDISSRLELLQIDEYVINEKITHLVGNIISELNRSNIHIRDVSISCKKSLPSHYIQVRVGNGAMQINESFILNNFPY